MKVVSIRIEFEANLQKGFDIRTKMFAVEHSPFSEAKISQKNFFEKGSDRKNSGKMTS